MRHGNSPQAFRQFVSYIDKSRTYYAAHGYERPFQWASYDSVPFAPLASLRDARVGVVTTAFPADHTGKKQAYAAPSQPVPDAMFTSDLSWDKDATHTNDVETFLPLAALQRLADEGTIGAVGERFFGVPTEYSRTRTEADADQVLAWAKADDLDAVLLVPI